MKSYAQYMKSSAHEERPQRINVAVSKAAHTEDGMETPMPRYFFDLTRGDETSADEKGIELADVESVRQHARRSARRILPTLPEQPPDQAFIVRDEAGQIVLTLDIKASANLPVG
jgi:hypothetical protein